MNMILNSRIKRVLSIIIDCIKTNVEESECEDIAGTVVLG